MVTNPANVRVSNGELGLTLASQTDGALVSSNPSGGAKPGFQFTYGYAEARVYFPGSGSTIYNWPAWWTDGQSWPTNGEIDIAEGLGTMTTNYHSPSGASNSGTISGTWSAGYHTYGVNRQPGKNDIYFDGKLVRSYATNDGGAPHYLIFNVGSSNSRTNVFGPASEVKIDYVRVWNAS
ncbi:glycoside hydrolase family 16 protein [Arthrobacter sp. M4]|uniref:glycoside hydrolase family 16 protein n=1 Tax=Arthrobacter sp. M4 TaxID=218160 RepID=UPI0027DF9FA5|nr:glycoside hydrolase family 16 protein [Arthrobacter sp. M4]